MRISDWSSDVCSSDLVAGEGRRGVAGVGEFEDAGDDVGEVGRRVGGRPEHGKLLEITRGKVGAADFMSRDEIKYKRIQVSDYHGGKLWSGSDNKQRERVNNKSQDRRVG